MARVKPAVKIMKPAMSGVESKGLVMRYEYDGKVYEAVAALNTGSCAGCAFAQEEMQIGCATQPGCSKIIWKEVKAPSKPRDSLGRFVSSKPQEEAPKADEDGWIAWSGGVCPIADGVKHQVMLNGEPSRIDDEASTWSWSWGAGITAYRIVKDDPQPEPIKPSKPVLSGGKLKGDHYYRVTVDRPISEELEPYLAECADIIEALNMTFNEGEAFKAIWRLAAARQGRGKPGNKAQYDADKIAHYGSRVKAQTERGSAKKND